MAKKVYHKKQRFNGDVENIGFMEFPKKLWPDNADISLIHRGILQSQEECCGAMSLVISERAGTRSFNKRLPQVCHVFHKFWS